MHDQSSPIRRFTCWHAASIGFGIALVGWLFLIPLPESTGDGIWQVVGLLTVGIVLSAAIYAIVVFVRMKKARGKS